MPDHSIHSNRSIEAATLQAEFESLHIPPNIDPRLLALWIEREQNEIEHKRQKTVQCEPKKIGRSLVRLFPAYIGISVMCLAILLGLIQQLETAAILQMACIAFLLYTIVGMLAGIVAEKCINDSVETLLHDIVGRNKDAGLNANPAQDVSV